MCVCVCVCVCVDLTEARRCHSPGFTKGSAITFYQMWAAFKVSRSRCVCVCVWGGGSKGES